MTRHPLVKTLTAEPRKFFMSLRDIVFWIRSARTDATFEKLREQYGPQKAFDLLYTEKQDPFGSVRSCWRYQRLKYERLISFLPNRQYRSALDVGCGLGPFTRQLSSHVDRGLGIDLSQAAVGQARLLSTAQPNLKFEQCDIRNLGRSGEQFDLISVLDVLYYLSPLSDDVLKSIASQLEGLLAPGGVLLLVNHFFFAVDSQSRQTRRIHDEICKGASLVVTAEYRRPFFLASILAHA